MNKVNIRVYKRGYKGTILIWNNDVLTEEQRKKVKVFIKMQEADDWFAPEVGMPDVVRMGRIMDGKTDTISVIHNDDLTAESSFMVKLVFGEGVNSKEATLLVEPKNQHRPYTKTERYQLPNGQFIYADPAYVVGLHPSVMDEIRQVVAEAIKGK